MKLWLNIVFSFVAHAAIITIAFALIGRDWTSPVPANFLTVSLVNELSEIKALHVMDQKKQAIHSSVSPTQNKAASGPYNYGVAVKEKASAETGLDDSHAISSVTDNNTEERKPKETRGATAEHSGPLHTTRGLPSSSGVAGYASLPVDVSPAGDLVHDQVKTQSKGKTIEDVTMSIRKSIEKVLVYPLIAKKRGLEGTALTEFTVNAKGYPEDIRIIESSGYNILDIAAKESLIKAAPFNAGKGRYEIPITFRLKIN
jgi:protein TonB